MIRMAVCGALLLATQSCAPKAGWTLYPPAPIKSEPAKPIADAADTCGMAAVTPFIGKSKDLLPPKPANAAWRVTCASCPVTMDYSPARLTILFEQDTGIVKQAKCG